MELIEHAEGLVPGPGFYRMPATVYHSDPAPWPSLSSTVANILIDKTPYHAQQAHPRLNGQGYSLALKAARVTVGSVVHEYLTGHGSGMKVVETDKGVPEDYRTKAAQEAREEILAMGKIPVLNKDLEKAIDVEQAIRAFFRDHDELGWVFNEGVGETVLIWQDPVGIWGRAMLDWWGGEKRPFDVIDIKTTTAGLDDRSIQRRIEDGIDLQESWYRRGLQQLWPDLAGRIRHRLVLAEQNPPFGVRVIELGRMYRYMGHRKVMHAAGIFRACQRTGVWPGYPPHVHVVDAPQWSPTQWEERELYDVMFQEFQPDIRLATSEQAPGDVPDLDDEIPDFDDPNPDKLPVVLLGGTDD